MSLDGTVCPDDWQGFDGHCYYFHSDEPLSFMGAQDFCNSLNSSLVSIKNGQEQLFLDATREGTFVFVFYNGYELCVYTIHILFDCVIILTLFLHVSLLVLPNEYLKTKVNLFH